MFGLVVATILNVGTGLQLVEQVQVRKPPTAVVTAMKGHEFILVPSLGKSAIFIGLHSPGHRFDLTEAGIEARRLDSKKLLWKRSADSAVLTEDGIVGLYANQMNYYSFAGELVSKQALPGRGVQWTHLDPGLKYALGFRLKPSKPNEWPLLVLDLTTQKHQTLPIFYDLGGHVNPSLRSFGRSAFIFDVFYAVRYVEARLLEVDWPKLGLDPSSFVVDVHDKEPLVMVSQLGSEERHIIDLSAERVVAKRLRSGSEFVMQSRAGDVFVWSWSAGTLQIFTLDR